MQETNRAGAKLSKSFFSDNGSTAVEVALKMSFQYHQQMGERQRTRFLAFRGSYHGDTLGAMSLGERKGFNEVFSPLLFDVDFVDPFCAGDIQEAFENHGHEYAAVIFEPMVQGASGMRMYGVDRLNQVAELAQKCGCLTIADEVFTGFSRTGKVFAFEHSNLRPDLLCLSKGLTAGFLPLAVTLVGEKLFETFHNQDMRKAFLHGHSYTANPVACAVALESLKMLKSPEWQKRIGDIEQWTGREIEELKNIPGVHNPRTLGTIGAFEWNQEDPNYFRGDTSYKFNQAALKQGVLLRPLGGTIYTVPPYCTSEQDFRKIYQVIRNLIYQGVE